MKRLQRIWIQNKLMLITCSLSTFILMISFIIVYHSLSDASFDANNKSVKTTIANVETETKQNLAQNIPEINDEQYSQKLNLPLSLISTGARNKNAPYAVILNKVTGKEILVYSGDTILKAVVTEIAEDQVRLRIGIAEQILSRISVQTEIDETFQDINKPPYSPEEIADRYNYDKDMKEVMSLMVQIKFAPGQSSDEDNGVIITRIQNNSVFEKIGLELDDMILSINEKKIESIDDSFEIYETLRTSKESRILIKRNNQLETLVYHNDYL